MPKIFLDIDDVIFNWYVDYAKRFNIKVPKSWLNSDLIKKRLDILAKEKNFWLNLSVKNIPNFPLGLCKSDIIYSSGCKTIA